MKRDKGERGNYTQNDSKMTNCFRQGGEISQLPNHQEGSERKEKVITGNPFISLLLLIIIFRVNVTNNHPMEQNQQNEIILTPNPLSASLLSLSSTCLCASGNAPKMFISFITQMWLVKLDTEELICYL